MTKIAPTKNVTYGYNTEEKYKDPLARWPLRGVAFSNDAGAVIKEIAPTLGMILWFPTMAYLGADIYDKYKYDKNNRSPDTKRALKQTIFQALATIVSPLILVASGQKAASIAARYGKTGLSLQVQQEISKFSYDFMKERRLKNYQKNTSGYKEIFQSSIHNKISESIRERQSKNIVSKIFSFFFSHHHSEKVEQNKVEKFNRYIFDKIDKMFEMREQLLQNKKPKEFSDKLFAEFKRAQEVFKRIPDNSSEYLDYATKDVLKKYELSRIMRIKMFKTLGGLASLALLIVPADRFVEKVLMPKIAPKIDKINIKNLKENGLLLPDYRKQENLRGLIL